MAEGQELDAVELTGLVARLFAAAGLGEEASSRVAGALVDADLAGQHSHGVMLVGMYLERLRQGSVSTCESGEIVVDRGSAVVLDARHALGQLIGDQAASLAVARAREHGTAAVAVRHAFHFGTARRYAMAIASAGCAGIAMCNTRPLMPAPGGAERVVGNNPIAIAIPTAGEAPLVLDMATSEAAMGKIRLAASAGEAIPPGWAVNEEGLPTTDPEEAISGMLLPAAGPKGFGLAFMIDLLCGLLSGGAHGDGVRPLYGDSAVPYDCAHLYIALDVAHFRDLGAVKAEAASAVERLGSGRRVPGVRALHAPGSVAWERRREAKGRVRLALPVLAMLRRAAGEMGIAGAMKAEIGGSEPEASNAKA